MKRQPVQPPLMQLVDRLQADQETEVLDLLVCLECLGLPVKRHHAQALYDMGMRGLGLYPKKGAADSEYRAAGEAIYKLQNLANHYNPDNQENRKQQ